MAVIHLSIPTEEINNCSSAVIGQPPTGFVAGNYRVLEPVCLVSSTNTTNVINTFSTRYDNRFQTQIVVLSGGGAGV